MANRSEHRVKVAENKEFLAAIDLEKWPQWGATLALYITLHALEQLLAEEGFHPNDHRRRNELIAEHHPHIFHTYANIYQTSRVARYDSTGEFLKTFSVDRVRNVITGSWLTAVENYVAAQLKILDETP